MMKKTLLWAAAALALLAGPASAGDFGLFGSYWNTEDADQTYGVGGKFDFARFFELRASYFNDVTADTSPERRDFEIHSVPLEAGLVFKFTPRENVTPYLGGGAGYYMLDTNRGEIDDETGWYAVAGTDIKTNRGLGFMVEGLYRNMEATVRDRGNDVTISDRVDLQLGGFGVNAGLIWTF